MPSLRDVFISMAILPRTSVPGFHTPPLRGWILALERAPFARNFLTTS